MPRRGTGHAVEYGIDDASERSGERGIAAIAHPLRVTPIRHQTCALELRQVSRHARLGGTEFLHEFANTVLFSIPEEADGAKPSGFGEGGEDRGRAGHGLNIRYSAYARKRIYRSATGYRFYQRAR